MTYRAIDGPTFRHVLGHYPTGVCIITSVGLQGPVGMVVGSFGSVSLDPPLVAFFPDRRSTSWPLIEEAGKFCANILASDQRDLCRRFAVRDEKKFAGVSHAISNNGSPVLDGIVAWIDCDIYKVHEAGDHYIVLGRVVDLEVARPGRPLLFLQGGYGEFASLP